MTQLLLTVAGLTVAGLVSPGPNFVLITGRALSSGTRSAVATASGVSLGSLTHAVVGIAGFGALLRSSETAFLAAKLLGSAYLIWIGVRSLRGAWNERRRHIAGVGHTKAERGSARPAVGLRRSFFDGYLTQMSNPKSTLFFLALFTTVVPADTTALQGAVVIATIVALALAVYSTIAVVFSRPVFQRSYRRVGHWFDALFGALMIVLGVRVAFVER